MKSKKKEKIVINLPNYFSEEMAVALFVGFVNFLVERNEIKDEDEISEFTIVCDEPTENFTYNN